jgi:hypothetical protein
LLREYFQIKEKYHQTNLSFGLHKPFSFSYLQARRREKEKRALLRTPTTKTLLYHFNLNHEMKAVLLSSPSHQAHNRKCPYPLPSSHRHCWLRLHHLCCCCCCWFQHCSSATQSPTCSGAKWKHFDDGTWWPASILKSQAPVQRFPISIMCEKWPRCFGRAEVSRNVVVLI